MWRELSLQLILLTVPKAAIYVPAGFCLVVLLLVLWRIGAFRKRSVRLSTGILVSGLVMCVIGQELLAKAKANYLLATANQRIASIRKAPAEIKILDSKGNAVPGARVRIEQRHHSFLFGCNAFWFDHHPDDQNQVYAERFSALFNYAKLAFYWGMYEPQKGDCRVYEQKHKALAGWHTEIGFDSTTLPG